MNLQVTSLYFTLMSAIRLIFSLVNPPSVKIGPIKYRGYPGRYRYKHYASKQLLFAVETNTSLFLLIVCSIKLYKAK